MTLARFKDLCLDAADPARAGAFWAAVLGRAWQAQDNGDGYLTGPTPQHTIWVNAVPEAKTVKNRVHLDIYARSLADLEALGASVVTPQGGDRTWTVMADPEGGEFCAFLRPAELPAERLHGLVIDCADPQAAARWWGSVYGVDVTVNDGWYTLEGVPGMPIATMDFVPVPEPKAAKNRVHWDVTVAGVAPLIAAGATVLREPDAAIRWHVMADPEGNEFCAFAG
jgi:catechol 2,3-dioxygenase-like lactoylglutathione lyase family enzyme